MSNRLRPKRSMKGNSLNFPSFFSRNRKETKEKSDAAEVATRPLKADDSDDSDVSEADADIVLASPLFDVQWYQRQTKLLASSADKRELVLHYLRQGAAQDCDPHPLFDTSYYKANSPDLAGRNPLVHFLTDGGKQGLSPHAEFDAAWYQSSYADVRAAGANPLVHYLTSGAREGRRPNSHFDCAWYARTYLPAATAAVLSEADTTALEHFVRFSQQQKLARNREEYRCFLGTDALLETVNRAYEERALPLYTSKPMVNRVNLVADRLVLEETATTEALPCLLAVRLAITTGAALRVVTRKEELKKDRWSGFLSAAKTPMPSKVEFIFCDFLSDDLSDGYELSMSSHDVFVVEDQHNLHSVRASVPAGRIIYAKLATPTADERDEQHWATEQTKSTGSTGSICRVFLAASDTDFTAENAPAITASRRVCERVFA